MGAKSEIGSWAVAALVCLTGAALLAKPLGIADADVIVIIGAVGALGLLIRKEMIPFFKGVSGTELIAKIAFVIGVVVVPLAVGIALKGPDEVTRTARTTYVPQVPPNVDLVEFVEPGVCDRGWSPGRLDAARCNLGTICFSLAFVTASMPELEGHSIWECPDDWDPDTTTSEWVAERLPFRPVEEPADVAGTPGTPVEFEQFRWWTVSADLNLRLNLRIMPAGEIFGSIGSTDTIRSTGRGRDVAGVIWLEGLTRSGRYGWVASNLMVKPEPESGPFAGDARQNEERRPWGLELANGQHCKAKFGGTTWISGGDGVSFLCFDPARRGEPDFQLWAQGGALSRLDLDAELVFVQFADDYGAEEPDTWAEVLVTRLIF